MNPTRRHGGFSAVGTWLSLVEHSLGVRGVGSSNLPVPTILHFSYVERSLESGIKICAVDGAVQKHHFEQLGLFRRFPRKVQKICFVREF
jgi:hypothetical protein